MLNVFETGEESFRLSNSNDEEVGWIRGDALGFTGFDTEDAAIAAALRGGDALRGYLERLSGTSEVIEESKGKVKLVHDGAYEWVTRGSTQLARLYRPEPDSAQRKRGVFAVEFVLPSYVRSGTVISAAQVVYHAVSRVAESKGVSAPGSSTSRTVAGSAAAREPEATVG